jgi:predicted nucleotidyltransferase
MIKTLTENENLALLDFKRGLQEKFGNVEATLFGSKSRGDYDDYSDIDILVVLDKPSSNSIEEEIFDLGFDVEMEYNVILGIIVYSKEAWNYLSGMSPFHRNVIEEGVAL